MITCPICGDGELHELVELNEHTYRGVTEKVPMFWSECDHCGSETATADQLKDNKRVMVAFRQIVDEELDGGKL